MISREERDALQLWLAAFEPAVDVAVTDEAVFVWSNRPNWYREVVRCGRTKDLQQELSSGLSQLVERMS
jgi:hypothetical protein